MASRIEHSGVVERTADGAVYVKITSRSACGACKARQACGLAEAEEKTVEVHATDVAEYVPGEAVTVGVKRSAGGLAVALAYVGALIVLVAALVVTVGVLGWDEGWGALATLSAVVVYYGVLWLFRGKIEHTIQFTITKN